MNQEVQEDGIVQPSAIAKFEFKTYEPRVVEFGANALPLNLYPDNPPMVGCKITDIHSGMGPVCVIEDEPKEQ